MLLYLVIVNFGFTCTNANTHKLYTHLHTIPIHTHTHSRKCLHIAYTPLWFIGLTYLHIYIYIDTHLHTSALHSCTYDIFTHTRIVLAGICPIYMPHSVDLAFCSSLFFLLLSVFAFSFLFCCLAGCVGKAHDWSWRRAAAFAGAVPQSEYTPPPPEDPFLPLSLSP